MSRTAKLFLFGMLASLFTLSSCSFFSAEADPNTSASETPLFPAPDTAETATPVPQPLRVLNICLGQEPNTLYINDQPNDAAKAVLEAIYDGPIDRRGYEYQPVILQRIPSLTEGGANITTIPVTKGDWVVNSDNEKVELVQGVRVYPAGCKQSSCITTYKEGMTLQMEQMIVEFSLLPNLRWSDGEPISSDDSVYAYQVARNSKNPATEFLLTRTENYETTDDLTTIWTGIPGYLDVSYMENYWQPLPYHEWGEFTADELVGSDLASQFPLGWGAYVVDEWLPGERITLVKNPLYHRAEENLPRMDLLNFRFFPNPDEALVALLEGRCDLLDPSIPLDEHVAFLQELDTGGEFRFYTAENIAIESLHFGIKPASYDDGTVGIKDRPRIFNDPRTRQAIAFCLDRQTVVDTVLHGLVDVPDTYIPGTHPLYTSSLYLYPFDPNRGASMLNEIGWKDLDNDENTPRTAFNVADVPVDTPLELEYFTTTTATRRQASEILANSLRECGVGVNIHYLSPDEFYALAPEGPLFGRNFDLAQFAMGSKSIVPRCDWFSAAAIPNQNNDWKGENLSGFSNPAYEEACTSARFSLPGSTQYTDLYRQTLSLYAEELPAIPLYPYINLAIAKFDLEGFSLDPSAATSLWNIEEFFLSYQHGAPLLAPATETPTPSPIPTEEASPTPSATPAQ